MLSQCSDGHDTNGKSVNVGGGGARLQVREGSVRQSVIRQLVSRAIQHVIGARMLTSSQALHQPIENAGCTTCCSPHGSSILNGAIAVFIDGKFWYCVGKR